MGPSNLEVETLRSLNERMHADEKRGAASVPFFAGLLDSALRFRRASGAVVTHDEFLLDLANPANVREIIEPVGAIECSVYENTAVVFVLLRVEGKNDAAQVTSCHGCSPSGSTTASPSRRGGSA